MHMRLVRGFLAATVLLAGGAANSQDITAGKRIAQASCSGCHLVSPQQKKASDAVSSFSFIARMPSTTSASLTAFLSTPHARMPDLVLDRREIRDVSAYILSLRHSR